MTAFYSMNYSMNSVLICLSAKTSLFDHLLKVAAVLEPKNGQKCIFCGSLLHFTTFYGHLTRPEHSTLL